MKIKIIISTCLALLLVTLAFSQKPVIGAIRWDAWIGDIGNGLVDASAVGLQVERSLSPNKYHYRAPFYSKEISKDSIQCRGATQQIMDKEIAYAKDAGIDYWAFCWYPSHSGLDTARQLYLASKHKDDVKWSLLLGTNPFDYDKDLYKARHLIENFFAKLKQYRAIATRYDKTSQNFLGAIYLASILIWLN